MESLKTKSLAAANIFAAVKAAYELHKLYVENPQLVQIQVVNNNKQSLESSRKSVKSNRASAAKSVKESVVEERSTSIFEELELQNPATPEEKLKFLDDIVKTLKIEVFTELKSLHNPPA